MGNHFEGPWRTPSRKEFSGRSTDSSGVVVADRAGRPLVLEVLAPGLVGIGLPRVAGDVRSQRAPGPGDVGGDDAYRLLRLLDRLHQEFAGGIVVHLIEPLSFAWMIRVLRYRPRRYPVFLADGRAIASGMDEDAVASTIRTLLRHPPAG
jgi:hypothetical protein